MEANSGATASKVIADLCENPKIVEEVSERLKKSWMRDRVEYIYAISHNKAQEAREGKAVDTLDVLTRIEFYAREALDAPVCKCGAGAPDKHIGEWLNGDNYEYEFAYCSECGHAQWASWDSHFHAREEISDFHKEYRFCPNCGARMTGGSYISRKEKKRGGK